METTDQFRDHLQLATTIQDFSCNLNCWGSQLKFKLSFQFARKWNADSFYSRGEVVIPIPRHHRRKPLAMSDLSKDRELCLLRFRASDVWEFWLRARSQTPGRSTFSRVLWYFTIAVSCKTLVVGNLCTFSLKIK